MHITKTQAFTVENLCFINLPTYDHGRLVVTEGSPNSGEVDHRLEIDGISQKAWRAEIHNFTRCQGYETGEDAQEVSAWLSNMADTPTPQP